jgi:hypothetical protein
MWRSRPRLRRSLGTAEGGRATVLALIVLLLPAGSRAKGAEDLAPRSSTVVSLDAPDWLVAPDPKNVGRQAQWWRAPRADARRVRVPGIFQEALGDYHGVAWYWRDFAAPANPRPQGRYLLRFWMVDYLADVWLNGIHVGRHEGGEEAFVLDLTDAIKPGAPNRLAVRVLNPTAQPIDGMALRLVPGRNKLDHVTVGNDYNFGGIVDSVELLVTPAVRVEDLFLRPDWKTGEIRIEASLHSALSSLANVRLSFTVAPAASGETLDTVVLDRPLSPGDTVLDTKLKVAQPRLWSLGDPNLYRVTARAAIDGSASFDETSKRCGFRDFRFENGAFRLNGKRIFLRSSHSGNEAPVGLRVPLDPDLLRRDMLNCKVMGFNMIRFFCAIPRRYQLDLCDEIGFLVYEESLAGWCLDESDELPQRFDTSIRGMIRRDRNHPSVVMWGLLNENMGDAAFYYALSRLPFVRQLDDTRIVMLNSGRFDAGRSKGPASWYAGAAPTSIMVAHNGRKESVGVADSTWAPGQFSLHPGLIGQYSAVCWTATEAGEYAISAAMAGLCRKPTTTDIHIYRNGTPLMDSFINLHGLPNAAKFAKTLTLAKGDRIGVFVGTGGDSPYSDTTALDLTIKSPQGKVDDVAADFSTRSNPNGPWSYGWLAPGAKPDPATFTLYTASVNQEPKSIGSLSNPGSRDWQDVLADQHPYQPSPHKLQQIRNLRDCDPGQPVFISEYGLASAVDLVRQVRHYEQIGHPDSLDARLYRGLLEKFMADWQRWRMADTFANPEDYFRQCVAKMAGLRLMGLNAIRANPRCVGHSMTGMYDHGFCGEGATASEFRELKPGATDALLDGFAPLRFCLFVEPVNVYRGAKLRLDAVLANEDALPPGEYPVRLQIVGPNGRCAFQKTVTVKIADPRSNPPPPLATAILGQRITIDGPSGQYRFLAAFQQGGAAAGGNVEFYVDDPADMPKVETEIVRWGDDPALDQWLAEHGIKTRPFAAGRQNAREVILVGQRPAGGGAAAWRSLAQHIARGSAAVFLCPGVFAKRDNPVAWVPLTNKGRLDGSPDWLYLHDPWTKRHPIFDGLPCGHPMDYIFYRELISNDRWAGLDAPAETVAASINACFGYDSGTLVSVHELGAGRFILNTLAIRPNLGGVPPAERLLRNLLRYAARDASGPAAELPANFQRQLQAMGYY